jgi:hypothetical protein
LHRFHFKEGSWDGKDDFGKEVASGIYLYRIYVSSVEEGSRPFEVIRKMTLFR